MLQLPYERNAMTERSGNSKCRRPSGAFDNATPSSKDHAVAIARGRASHVDACHTTIRRSVTPRMNDRLGNARGTVRMRVTCTRSASMRRSPGSRSAARTSLWRSNQRVTARTVLSTVQLTACANLAGPNVEVAE